jgi:hypothetical protein
LPQLEEKSLMVLEIAVSQESLEQTGNVLVLVVEDLPG